MTWRSDEATEVIDHVLSCAIDVGYDTEAPQDRVSHPPAGLRKVVAAAVRPAPHGICRVVASDVLHRCGRVVGGEVVRQHPIEEVIPDKVPYRAADVLDRGGGFLGGAGERHKTERGQQQERRCAHGSVLIGFAGFFPVIGMFGCLSPASCCK